MQTAVLCYVQLLNNGICTAYEYFFRLPLSVMPIRILSVNKILRNLGRIQFIVCATSTRPFGEVGGMSPLQLSSQTHLAKIEDKKVIAKQLF